MSKLKKIIGFLLIAVLLIVGVMFALLNETAVPLDLFFVVTPPIHVSLLVFIAFATGVLLGMFVTGLTLVKSRMNVRRLKRADNRALLSKA
jgi:putative membrane protein